MWCARQSIAEVTILVCGVSMTYADETVTHRLFKFAHSSHNRGDFKG
jgi:hypothetical protein